MSLVTCLSVSIADDEKSCMLLVMRVLSIVPLNFKVSKEMMWDGCWGDPDRPCFTGTGMVRSAVT